MIRIYVNAPGGIELVVRDKGTDLSTMPISFASSEPRARSAAKRSMSLPWVALLVVVSVGLGYVASPHAHGAHAATSPAGVVWQAAPDLLVPPGASPDATSYMPPPPPPSNSGAQAVTTALATAPSVTPASAPSRPEKEPGTAAFGLQP